MAVICAAVDRSIWQGVRESGLTSRGGSSAFIESLSCATGRHPCFAGITTPGPGQWLIIMGYLESYGLL